LRLAAAFLLLGTSANAATYLILPDGTGDLATIQAALDVVVDGDSVVLGNGVFDVRHSLEFRGADIVFRSQSGDPSVCILDADQEHEALNISHGESAASVLEGVTIRNAKNWDGFGGAVLCYGASPTIRHCVFSDNAARWGGGVSSYNASPTIEDCVFQDNSAGAGQYPGWGGGLSVVGGAPRISDCKFIGNVAGGTGGGIDVHLANPTIVNCQVMGCALDGVYCSGGSPEISGCVITGNRGAGFACSEGVASITSSTIACNNGFDEGGGIRVIRGAEARADRCVIWRNCSDAGFGNAFVRDTASLTFMCCVVDSSGIGGGGSIIGRGDQSFADPQFCNPSTCEMAPTDQGDYAISGGSPCTPEHSACGELIGALPASCSPPMVEPTTWGAIKEMFRR
jgi:hypothetical protein